MKFYKYHALGNDYIVLNPADFPDWPAPTPVQIRLICHRNFGVGSDGILWGPLPSPLGGHGVRIFNPDGSEAEKSGNGTRIFARFLWDQGIVREPTFAIDTPGGPRRDVINEKLVVQGREFIFCAATIGNPHCVIVLPEISAELARQYGPEIEAAPIFPRRTNVQFMKVLDRRNLQIEIWERGAGYTLASGTSSSAAAAVAFRLGSVDRAVTMHMPGGTLEIEIGEDYRITMTGTATRIAQGVLELEL